MKKPIIGIIGRAGNASDDDKAIYTKEEIRRAIIKCGGIPLLVVPTQDIEYDMVDPIQVPRMTKTEKELLYQQIQLCDGIVMPGGSKWYEYDEVACTYTLEQDIPMLGICMGMQIIAKIYSNCAEMAKDETVLNKSDLNHHRPGEKYVHEIEINPDSYLRHLLKTNKVKVNSRHRYHVEQYGDLIVSAKSDDGLIEGLEAPDKRYVLGLQWHPESMLEFDDDANKIWNDFIDVCAKYHTEKKKVTNFQYPMIGIIGRPDALDDGTNVICVWEAYRRVLVRRNTIPIVFLPNQDIDYESIRPGLVEPLTEIQKKELEGMISFTDGMLIPGGYRWYQYDCVLYEEAYAQNMPILGICTGMQMMARIDNQTGTNQFYPNILNETVIDHHQRDVKYVHEVEIITQETLYTIIKKNKFMVNSRHNYHIPKTQNFHIAALSEDGLIEAIESADKKFVIGVQWHPETMDEYDENAKRLFDYFINLITNTKRIDSD